MLLPCINLRPRAAPPLLYVPVVPDDGIRQPRSLYSIQYIQRHGVPDKALMWNACDRKVQHIIVDTPFFPWTEQPKTFSDSDRDYFTV
jgi:hypothetical protein